MMPLNLTCLHCLQYPFFEHLFNLYYKSLEKKHSEGCIQGVKTLKHPIKNTLKIRICKLLMYSFYIISVFKWVYFKHQIKYLTYLLLHEYWICCWWNARQVCLKQHLQTWVEGSKQCQTSTALRFAELSLHALTFLRQPRRGLLTDSINVIEQLNLV